MAESGPERQLKGSLVKHCQIKVIPNSNLWIVGYIGITSVIC